MHNQLELVMFFICIFSSEAKYDSGTGWPSFYQAYENGKGHSNVIERPENSAYIAMFRTEVICKKVCNHIIKVMAFAYFTHQYKSQLTVGKFKRQQIIIDISKKIYRIWHLCKLSSKKTVCTNVNPSCWKNKKHISKSCLLKRFPIRLSII